MHKLQGDNMRRLIFRASYLVLDEHKIRSSLRQSQRDGAPDALRSSGTDHDFIFQTKT